MAQGNGELIHEYFPKHVIIGKWKLDECINAFSSHAQQVFPKHLCMETARIKYDKETDEDSKMRLEHGK